MLRVFLEVVLPVALVAIAGGLAGRWRRVPVEPVSALVFYLFSPALVFESMATTQLSAEESLSIVAIMLGTFGVIYAASMGWSLLRGHDSPMRAAFAIGTTTPNAGNMGLPVAQLAFGDAGLEVAVMNFVASATLTNTAGIAVASMAGGDRRDALTAPFRYPALYAAVLGILVNVVSLDMPIAVEAPVHSLAVAAVPTMLVVLGLQLQHAGGRERHVVDTLGVTVAKLVLAPGVTWLVAAALGVDGLTRGVLVILAAMPTAVVATILATEFNAMPAFVTRIVVVTTLASMLTLTLLITLVR